MRKKVLFITIVLMICMTFLCYKIFQKRITPTLAIIIDGESVTSIPSTGHYDLTSYTCDSGSTITWDKINLKLKYSIMTSSNEFCVLNFTTASTFLLNTVELGSYVLYEGSSGCNSTSNNQLDTVFNSQCKGMNVNYVDIDDMGYCSEISYNPYKYYTTGWRVAYFLDSDSDSILEPYIVSAGSPSCVTGTSNNSTTTITSLNTEAIKYCNPNYAYGGGCQSTYDAGGSNYNTWALKGLDYYQITLQLLGEGRRLYSYDTVTESTTGTTCVDVDGIKECGYNNDLIDNGGEYWFGSAYNSTNTLIWSQFTRRGDTYGNRYVNYDNYTSTHGERSVVHLKSSIYVSGGSGTQEDPYIIGY